MEKRSKAMGGQRRNRKEMGEGMQQINEKEYEGIHDSYSSNGGLMRPPGEPVSAVLPPQAHLTVVVACTGYGRHALKTETPMMVLRKVITMKNMVFET